VRRCERRRSGRPQPRERSPCGGLTVARSRGAPSSRAVPRRRLSPRAAHDRRSPAGRGTSRSRDRTPSRPHVRERRKTSSPVGTRDLLDVRTQAVVATPQSERLGALLQRDVGGDRVDLLPRGSHSLAARKPRRNSTRPSCATTPGARSAEYRDDLELLAGPTLEQELVDVSAAATIRVEQLVVDEQETQVYRPLAQF